MNDIEHDILTKSHILKLIPAVNSTVVVPERPDDLNFILELVVDDHGVQIVVLWKIVDEDLLLEDVGQKFQISFLKTR